MKILLLLIATFLSSCALLTKKQSNPKELFGVYHTTEKLPADIGPPFRQYIYFDGKGTMYDFNSIYECDSLRDILKGSLIAKGRIAYDGKKITAIVNGTYVGGEKTQWQFKANVVGNTIDAIWFHSDAPNVKISQHFVYQFCDSTPMFKASKELK